jgi:hypothetical protein
MERKRQAHMSSKVGQDSNYVAHHVEIAISSREAEIRARKLRQLAVLACVVGFLLVAAFIALLKAAPTLNTFAPPDAKRAAPVAVPVPEPH